LKSLDSRTSAFDAMPAHVCGRFLHEPAVARADKKKQIETAIGDSNAGPVDRCIVRLAGWLRPHLGGLWASPVDKKFDA
jgi:hypothetical protein